MKGRPDIAVVIPCYNHAYILRRTIEAVLNQTLKPLEVVVVDDGSADDPKSVYDAALRGGRGDAAEIRWSFIRFDRNRGAPAARNEGAKRTSAPHILFLDADAILKPHALESFLQALEEHPEADFAYSNFLWGAKRFRGRPFDPEALRRRNYIHTSSLIRRSAFPGFDETLNKFQDWDLWLTMSERGSKGVWIDEDLYRVEPRKAGMSRWLPKIAYRIPWHRLGFQPKEIGRYREAEHVVRKKHGIEDGAVVISRDGRMRWTFWFVAIVLLEAVSLATVFVPPARAVATILAGAIMSVVAIRRPDIGLAALLAELAIGSKGALLKIPEGWEVDGGTSLRIVLVVSFVVGWVVNMLRAGSWKDAKALVRGRGSWIALAGLCMWASIRGVLEKNPNVLSDANAWGYLILLPAVLDVARRDGSRLIATGRDALLAALVWLPMKTLALLYVWSHGIKTLSQPLYLWVRRTGVGEVTLVTANLFRVFIQSQVYALAGFFGTLAVPDGPLRKRLHHAVLTGCAVSLLIGLSRSLWIGLSLGGLALLAMSWRARSIPSIFARGAAAGVAAGALVFIVVAFPVPRVEVGSLKTLFGSRASTGDAAAESRWNLLPVLVGKIKEAPILGSGFGATVTYRSKDPRILAQNPDGLYTTYAFEWGWLEHWIKFGIFGIPVMSWLLVSLGRRLLKTEHADWLKRACVATIVGLGALHVFTPYLNHPLGFGILLSVEALIAASRPESSRELRA